MHCIGRFCCVLAIGLAWAVVQQVSAADTNQPAETNRLPIKPDTARQDLAARLKHWENVLDDIRSGKPSGKGTFSRAKDFVKDCAATYGPDAARTLQAKVLIGTLLAHAGQLTAARDLLEGCLDFCENEPSHEPLLQARLYNALAAVESRLGRHARALEHYQQARRLLGKDEEEAISHRGERQAVLATACDGIGTSLSALGRYDRAIEAYERAIRIWSSLAKDDRQWKNAEAGFYRSQLNLAETYKSQGRRTMAIFGPRGRRRVSLKKYYEALIPQVEKRFASSPRDLIPFYKSQADLYLRIGELDLAEMTVRKLRVLTGSCDDTSGKLAAKHLSARIKYQRGLWGEAEQEWNSLLHDYKTHGPEVWIGRTLQRLGDVAGKKKDWGTAESRYRESKNILDRIGALPVARFNAEFGLAYALSHGGKLASVSPSQREAIACLKRGITIIEAAGANATGGSAFCDRFYAQFADGYDLLVKLLIEYDPASALFYADRLHNLTLGGELQRAGADLFADVDPHTRQKLIANMEVLFQQRDELLAKMQSRSAPDDVVRQLNDLEHRIAEQWNHMLDASRLWQRALASSISPASFQQEVKQLVAPNCVILRYYLGRSESYVWTITNKGIRYHPLVVVEDDGKRRSDTPVSLTYASARSLVGQYIDTLKRPRQLVKQDRGWETAPGPRPKRFSPKENLEDTTRQALALTATLLPAAVRREVADCRRVIIVPDGPLHGLPFSALVLPCEKNGPLYVIDRLPPISYAPSLQGLIQLQQRAGQSLSRATIMTTGGAFLPGSANECRAIAALFTREQVISLIGKRAEERWIKTYLPQCRIFHFADHAVFENQYDNLFGHLKLRDGDLELLEIYDLNLLGCELVVLSACETHLGAYRRLETGNSLARAFLVAGARRVVSSFWRVNDEETTPLMVSFLAEVADPLSDGEPVDYAAALHSAMRRMRNEGKPPYYWAPFSLIGPPRSM